MDMVGKSAPDFKLKSNTGEEVTLSDFLGKKNILVIFYPMAFSGTCSIQLPEFSQKRPEFEQNDTVVLGISRDSVHAQRAWAKEYGIDVPLLSDMTGKVAKDYNVYLEDAGFNKRATFLIGKDGKIIYQYVEDSPGNFTLHADQLLNEIKKLQ